MAGRNRACITVDDDLARLLDSLGESRAAVLRRALHEYLTKAEDCQLVKDLRDAPEIEGATDFEYTLGAHGAGMGTGIDVSTFVSSYYRKGYLKALDDIEAKLQSTTDQRMPHTNQHIIRQLKD